MFSAQDTHALQSASVSLCASVSCLLQSASDRGPLIDARSVQTWIPASDAPNTHTPPSVSLHWEQVKAKSCFN